MKKLPFLLIIVFIVTGCATGPLIADPKPLLQSGVRHHEAGNYDVAISEIKKSINIYPLKNAFHHLGIAHYKKGEYDAAIEQFKTEIEREPDDPVNYGWIGQSYMRKEQYEDAVSYFQKAIANGNTNPYALKFLSYCYNNLNLYDDAIKAGIMAIEMGLDLDNEVHFELACAFFKTKRHKNAVKAYKKAIELDPKYPTYYNRWGTLLMGSGDYAGAAEQYQKAVSLQPNNKKYLSRLAGAYYKQGKYDEALDAVNKSINLSKLTGIGAEIGSVNAYPVIKETYKSGPAHKAGLLINDRIIKINGEKTKDSTIEKIIQALRGKEGTWVVLTIERGDSKKSLEATVTRERIFMVTASTGIGYRSFIQRHKGEKDESLKDAEQAYSLNSSDKGAQLALGAANLDQGRYDEAVKMFSQVKESINARILEATAYAKQLDFNKAIDMYSAIPEENLSPKNVPFWSDRTELLKALGPFIASKMESAGRLKTQGRYKEALKELGEAMKVADDTTSEEICGAIYRIMSMDPRLSELPEEALKYALRGDVQTEEGKFEGAVKEYLHAVQVAPYIAKLYFNTAMVYGELKRYPQAIRSMKTYLQLAPEAPNARAAKNQIYKWEFKMEKGN